MKPNIMYQVLLGIIEGRIHFGYFFGHDRKVFVAGIPGSKTRQSYFQQFARLEHFIRRKAM